MLVVPTGASVLSPAERALVPEPLLQFHYTMLTMEVYEEVLGLKLKDWSLTVGKRNADGSSNINRKAAVDMLVAGTYPDDGTFLRMSEDELKAARSQVKRLITPRAAPIVYKMINDVIEASSPRMSMQELERLAKKVANDPKPRSP